MIKSLPGRGVRQRAAAEIRRVHTTLKFSQKKPKYISESKTKDIIGGIYES